MGTVPPFRDLIAEARTSAVHLETRDAYTPDDPQYLDWLAGKPIMTCPSRTRLQGCPQYLDWLAGKPIPEPTLPDWHALVRTHVARGIRFRRARVVSEPLAPFIRFEHFITDATNIAAGEEVRWLPRRRASDLCLPGNDYWLFDDQLVRFHHFSGVGDIVEDELVSDPAVIQMCSASFEAVWERAIPHAEYRPV